MFDVKIAYLILAHNTPAHVAKLVAALATDRASFHLHIDAKSDLGRFVLPEGARVQLTSRRHAVYWGDFTMVKAILELIGQAVSDPWGAERFVLLSGSDYPLEPTPFIERFFAEARDWEFMDLVAMPHLEAGKPLTRLTQYRISQSDPRVVWLLGKVLRRLGVRLPTRDVNRGLRGLKPYGGSTWWALTRAAAEHILSFTERNPGVLRFFRHTDVPDEGYFHTILGNSEFGPRMRRNLMYRDFSAGGDNPALITDRHLDAFESETEFVRTDHYGTGTALFARKFSDDSGAVVERLERIRAEKARRRGV